MNGKKYKWKLEEKEKNFLKETCILISHLIIIILKGAPMKLHKPLIAILIGIAPGIIPEIYTQIMKYFGLTTVSTIEVISMMWIREGSWLLGNLGVIGFGSWLGLIIYYSTKFLGTDYLPIKAMFLTMTSESLVFNIFGILGGNSKLTQNVSGNFVHASAAAIGGLCVGFLMKIYILNKKPQERKVGRYFLVSGPAITKKIRIIKSKKIR